ncbi:DNA replication/repair protein RecF [Sphingomonas panacisoli]|uniref:DNA replication and repair protein RecF n=1 Tax=Sphingomonas panacisoli TaxID=1813879 RepID=A0A5B8LEH8_9SPHN|nr:DNA replication/repair protein RecF [Sphingomonas panacisoli]QDZ06175.1 DNA replication/repair protein RecF [Sphingomonas panacisoli]
MLSRLVLTDFRNHAEAVLHPGRGFVVLTGDNGAGKTNVLEAVSLLAPGRGLRRAPLSDMARQGGAGGFGVATTLFPSRLREGLGEGVSFAPSSKDLAEPLPNPSRKQEGESQVGTGTLATAPERRIVRINGATAAATALAEWLTVLWLTPAMDRLFVEPAGERRRFLDRLTLALRPDHAGHANRYEAAMRARNRLLAEDGPHDDAWLSALEAQMAEHGAAIDAARRETVARLGERLADQPAGPFARAGLALEGWTDTGTLAADLAQGRRRDAAAGRTLAGPHRSDLAVTHLEKQQPAALCSTGEQKALLLGLVLAHAELTAARTGRAPVLLLDEVAAHLDPSRRAALFDRLAATGGQVWMTGTERSPFDGIGQASWYDVADGRITARS